MALAKEKTPGTHERNYKANLMVKFKRPSDKNWCIFIANKKWSEQDYINHLNKYFDENSYIFNKYIVVLVKDDKVVKMVKLIDGKISARKVTRKDVNRIRLDREALGGQRQTVNA